MALIDPTCQSYSEGTLERYFCENIQNKNWSYKDCSENGRERGHRTDEVLRALKAILDTPVSLELACFSIMLDQNIEGWPREPFRDLWNEYLEHCEQNCIDYRPVEEINNWVVGRYKRHRADSPGKWEEIVTAVGAYFTIFEEEDWRHLPYEISDVGYLVDPSCNKYPPGTIQKFVALNLIERGWSLERCIQEGVARGLKPEQIRNKMSHVISDSPVLRLHDSSKEAYYRSLYSGQVAMPHWMHRAMWLKYVDTCAMLGYDHRDDQSIRWWIEKYCTEPFYHIRPNAYMREQLFNLFRRFVQKPPKKPLITRYLEMFNTYDTRTFAASDAAAVPAGEKETTRELPQPDDEDWTTCHVCGHVSRDKDPKFCTECGNSIIE